MPILNLKKIREARGYSISELGKALDVTPFTVWRWEAGSREPSLQKITEMVNFLKVTPNDLLGVDEKRPGAQAGAEGT